MPTQLQLEGRELAPLLDRVRSELGPHARILSAEKVRSGGIGGFFARQRFELTVEVDEPPAEPSATTWGPAPATWPVASPVASPVSPDAPPPAAPASLLELADRVSDHEHAAAVSTETPSFTSLLSRLGVSIDGSPASPVPPVAVPAPRRPTEPSVTTAAQTTAITTATAPAGPTGSAPAGPTTVALAPGTPAVWTPTAGTPTPSAPVPPAPIHLTPAAVALAAQSAAAVATRDDAGNPALPRTACSAVAVLPPPATGPADDGRSAGELSRLGLPAHLQPLDGDEPVYPALLQSLRRLPKAPRTTNRGGEVLAVVGPLHLALELARQMAGDLGLPLASAVFVATEGPVATGVSARQQVQDVNTATTHRATWRRRRNLTVVAIDAPLTSAGAQQARSFLAAFGPTAVWGVVEATRKPHDVGAWTRAVGGVHALALTGVEETADPAAVLSLGIPVGRLGCRPASPAVWASLLTGRLVS